MHPLIEQLRPLHWTKNLIVFAGVFFAGAYWLIPQVTILFLSFCATASAVYIINDLADQKADRKHPTKRFRPLASGKITTVQAYLLATLCLLFSIICSFFMPFEATLYVIGYFILQLLYSFWLKHIAVLDIFLIAVGFMIRGFAGTEGIDLPSSPWFITTIIAVSLFLVFSKRAHEKTLPASSHRKSIETYTPAFLRSAMLLSMMASLCFYSLYIIETKHGIFTLLTILFVFFGFIRYLYLIDTDSVSGDPVVDFFKDKTLLITLILWAVTFFIGVYVLP